MPQTYLLQAISGAQPGALWALDRPMLVVGSAAGCDILLPGLAPQHARLYWHGDRLCIQDLSGTVGTVVNGARLTAPAFLSAGDTIVLGPVTLQLQIGEAPPAYAPPPAQQPAAPYAQPAPY
ncbi:MAG: FHA domain-containing protein, partial [Anaerolineae bacterium]